MGCPVKIYPIMLLLILTVPQEGTSLPNGAPIEACFTLMPQHLNTAPQPSETNPYLLVTDGETYMPGGTVRVRLVLRDSQYLPFRGFILQARRGDDGTPFGSWQVSLAEGNFWKYLVCPQEVYTEATITHTDNTVKYPSVDYFITWNAPQSFQKYPDTVDFIASVVYNFTTYWVNQQVSVSRQDINACLSRPCLNGGQCADLVNAFLCLCPAGFTGALCESNINACLSRPCLNGGQCADLVNAFLCLCPAGFSGALCESNINECVSQPCLNGGQCADLVNAFVCLCPAGFSGALCESNINACLSRPCLNGGQCADLVNAFLCLCPAGFSGALCESSYNACDSRPCLNGATCFGSVAGYHCLCPVGFTGPTCRSNMNECVSQPCLNGGQCADLVNAFQCLCPAGFSGALCESIDAVPACESNPCLNGGLCLESVVDQTWYLCLCQALFTGMNCENVDAVPACESNPCLNGGLCLESGGQTLYICQCQAPFTGNNCENESTGTPPKQCFSPCLNGGTCVDGSQTFPCLCPVGFVGRNCEVVAPDQCTPNSCLNGGTCFVGVTSTCLCTEGFTGVACEVDSAPPEVMCPADLTFHIPFRQVGMNVSWMAPIVTDNSGNFTMVSNSHNPGDNFEAGVTVVTYGYEDTNGNHKSCIFTVTIIEEIPANQCNSNPCQNGGTCLRGPDIICLCDRGFAGSNCEVNPCDSNPCKNSGTCEHSGNGIICNCAEGFVGTNCTVDNGIPKLLYCPGNIVKQITSATTEQLPVMWTEPNGTDNSRAVSVILFGLKGPGSLFPLGSTTLIKYFIVDPSKNAVECFFNVTVEDEAPPIITYCPANITRQVTSVIQQGLFITWNLPEATDLSNQNVTVVPASPSQPMPGSFFPVRSTNIIQYNISDVLNNTAFCSFTVTVDLCACYTNATMQSAGDLCIIDNSCNIDVILQDISEVPVDKENVEQIATVLANVTGYYDSIQANGVGSVGSTMESIAVVASSSTRVTEMVIETVDNMLNVAAESFSLNQSASAMILQAFESQLANPRDNISLIRDNIIVQVVSSSPQSYGESLGFATIPENGNIDDTLLNNREELFIGGDQIPVVEAETSILIPEEAFTIDIANSTVNFVVYQNAKLFQVTQRKGLDVNSRVISGSLAGKEKQVINLMNPVVTSFRPLNNTSPADTICVFWDPTLVAGNSVGNWSTKGCRLAEDKGVGQAKICHCDHLTSFAILISYGGDAMYPVLDVLSKVGCGISIAALILTILVTLSSSDLSTTPQKTLLNLCVSLILLYGVFLVGIELVQPRVACIIFAALIHYFFLSSVCWSSAEAMVCFHLLVLTRRNLVRGYLLRIMLFCWCLPALIVFITFAVPYFGSGQWNVPDEKYCFLSPGNSIYFGVLLPVGALLLFNIFIYILVFRRLVCQRIDSSLTHQETRAELVLRQARIMIPIGILLGGTWIFGLLAIDIFTATFQYIFAILNSLIGLAVFIFFIFMRKNGRMGLRNLFCCRSADSMGSSGARGSHSTSDTRVRHSSNVVNSNTD